MNIVKYPAPSLLERSVDVDLKDRETIVFLMDMLGLYLTLQGRAIGLACPQVGKNIRAFISMGNLYVNPTIIERSKGTYTVFEGCLSLEDGKTYKVRRNKDITLKWTDVDEKEHEEKFTGFEAEVIQHEFDHLEGILINHATT